MEENKRTELDKIVFSGDHLRFRDHGLLIK